MEGSPENCGQIVLTADDQQALQEYLDSPNALKGFAPLDPFIERCIDLQASEVTEHSGAAPFIARRQSMVCGLSLGSDKTPDGIVKTASCWKDCPLQRLGGMSMQTVTLGVSEYFVRAINKTF